MTKKLNKLFLTLGAGALLLSPAIAISCTVSDNDFKKLNELADKITSFNEFSAVDNLSKTQLKTKIEEINNQNNTTAQRVDLLLKLVKNNANTDEIKKIIIDNNVSLGKVMYKDNNKDGEVVITLKISMSDLSKDVELKIINLSMTTKLDQLAAKLDKQIITVASSQLTSQQYVEENARIEQIEELLGLKAEKTNLQGLTYELKSLVADGDKVIATIDLKLDEQVKQIAMTITGFMTRETLDKEQRDRALVEIRNAVGAFKLVLNERAAKTITAEEFVNKYAQTVEVLRTNTTNFDELKTLFKDEALVITGYVAGENNTVNVNFDIGGEVVAVSVGTFASKDTLVDQETTEKLKKLESALNVLQLKTYALKTAPITIEQFLALPRTIDTLESNLTDFQEVVSTIRTTYNVQTSVESFTQQNQVLTVKLTLTLLEDPSVTEQYTFAVTGFRNAAAESERELQNVIDELSKLQLRITVSNDVPYDQDKFLSEAGTSVDLLEKLNREKLVKDYEKLSELLAKLKEYTIQYEKQSNSQTIVLMKITSGTKTATVKVIGLYAKSELAAIVAQKALTEQKNKFSAAVASFKTALSSLTLRKTKYSLEEIHQKVILSSNLDIKYYLENYSVLEQKAKELGLTINSSYTTYTDNNKLKFTFNLKLTENKNLLTQTVERSFDEFKYITDFSSTVAWMKKPSSMQFKSEMKKADLEALKPNTELNQNNFYKYLNITGIDQSTIDSNTLTVLWTKNSILEPQVTMLLRIVSKSKNDLEQELQVSITKPDQAQKFAQALKLFSNTQFTLVKGLSLAEAYSKITVSGRKTIIDKPNGFKEFLKLLTPEFASFENKLFGAKVIVRGTGKAENNEYINVSYTLSLGEYSVLVLYSPRLLNYTTRVLLNKSS